MFFLFGIGENQKVMGVFSNIPCMFCGKRNSMTITKQYSYFHLFFIPIFHFSVTYLVSCPQCSAVYTLDKRKAEQLFHNPDTVILTSDMHVVSRGFQLCSSCGAPVHSEDVFCPKCGQKL